jgi:hypothetical protein
VLFLCTHQPHISPRRLHVRVYPLQMAPDPFTPKDIQQLPVRRPPKGAESRICNPPPPSRRRPRVLISSPQRHLRTRYHLLSGTSRRRHGLPRIGRGEITLYPNAFRRY